MSAAPRMDSTMTPARVKGSTIALLIATATMLAAQTTGREALQRGYELWRQRLSKSALEQFEAATRDPATAAEAHEAIGRIYLFKGWQQEGVFPGWHDEPEHRERAIAELKASLAAAPSRATAVEALKQAEAFAQSSEAVPPAPPSPEVAALDAQLEEYRGGATFTNRELDALVQKRTTLQADPAPYFTTAQILLERKEYARAEHVAKRGAAATERFVAENEGAYKMAGKAAGARARGRAAALDILGTAALARMNFTLAARHLEEANRLTRGQDFLVRYHLGELARARKDLAAAQEHYLDALSLTGGPPAQRQRAIQAATDVHAALNGSAGFDAFLAEEIERRRNERRATALRSVVDRPLPALALTGLDGRPFDMSGIRGRVLLLNFFSSW